MAHVSHSLHTWGPGLAGGSHTLGWRQLREPRGAPGPPALACRLPACLPAASAPSRTSPSTSPGHPQGCGQKWRLWKQHLRHEPSSGSGQPVSVADVGNVISLGCWMPQVEPEHTPGRGRRCWSRGGGCSAHTPPPDGSLRGPGRTLDPRIFLGCSLRECGERQRWGTGRAGMPRGRSCHQGLPDPHGHAAHTPLTRQPVKCHPSHPGSTGHLGEPSGSGEGRLQ